MISFAEPTAQPFYHPKKQVSSTIYQRQAMPNMAQSDLGGLFQSLFFNLQQEKNPPKSL